MIFGHLVIIKKTGGEGSIYPITDNLTLGRNGNCGIRVQLPSVSDVHCRVEPISDTNQVRLHNLSATNPTLLNGKQFVNGVVLKPNDKFSFSGRDFIFQDKDYNKDTKRRSLSHDPAPQMASSNGRAATSSVIDTIPPKQFYTAASNRRSRSVSPTSSGSGGSNRENIKTLMTPAKESSAVDGVTIRKGQANSTTTPAAKGFATPSRGFQITMHASLPNLPPQKTPASTAKATPKSPFHGRPPFVTGGKSSGLTSVSSSKTPTHGNGVGKASALGTTPGRTPNSIKPAATTPRIGSAFNTPKTPGDGKHQGKVNGGANTPGTTSKMNGFATPGKSTATPTTFGRVKTPATSAVKSATKKSPPILKVKIKISPKGLATAKPKFVTTPASSGPKATPKQTPSRLPIPVSHKKATTPAVSANRLRSPPSHAKTPEALKASTSKQSKPISTPVTPAVRMQQTVAANARRFSPHVANTPPAKSINTPKTNGTTPSLMAETAAVDRSVTKPFVVNMTLSNNELDAIALMNPLAVHAFMPKSATSAATASTSNQQKKRKSASALGAIKIANLDSEQSSEDESQNDPTEHAEKNNAQKTTSTIVLQQEATSEDTTANAKVSCEEAVESPFKAASSSGKKSRKRSSRGRRTGSMSPVLCGKQIGTSDDAVVAASQDSSALNATQSSSEVTVNGGTENEATENSESEIVSPRRTSLRSAAAAVRSAEPETSVATAASSSTDSASITAAARQDSSTDASFTTCIGADETDATMTPDGQEANTTVFFSPAAKTPKSVGKAAVTPARASEIGESRLASSEKKAVGVTSTPNSSSLRLVLDDSNSTPFAHSLDTSRIESVVKATPASRAGEASNTTGDGSPIFKNAASRNTTETFDSPPMSQQRRGRSASSLVDFPSPSASSSTVATPSTPAAAAETVNALLDAVGSVSAKKQHSAAKTKALALQPLRLNLNMDEELDTDEEGEPPASAILQVSPEASARKRRSSAGSATPTQAAATPPQSMASGSGFKKSKRRSASLTPALSTPSVSDSEDMSSELEDVLIEHQPRSRTSSPYVKSSDGTNTLKNRLSQLRRASIATIELPQESIPESPPAKKKTAISSAKARKSKSPTRSCSTSSAESVKQRRMIRSAMENRKSVTFGSPLSPELFDKQMPPSTPIKKGAKPPGVSTPLLSKPLLKPVVVRSLSADPPGSSEMSTSPMQKVDSDPNSPVIASLASTSASGGSATKKRARSSSPEVVGGSSKKKTVKTPSPSPRRQSIKSKAVSPAAEAATASVTPKPSSAKKVAKRTYAAVVAAFLPSAKKTATPKRTPAQQVKAKYAKQGLLAGAATLKHPTIDKLKSTGHALSPETIYIRGPAKKKTPGSAAKRKTPARARKSKSPKALPAVSRQSGSAKKKGSQPSTPVAVASATNNVLIAATPTTPFSATGDYSKLSSPSEPSRMAVSPVVQPSPNLAGMREMLQTPREQPSPNLVGVREMLRSPPAATVSPSLIGVRKIFAGTSKTPINKDVIVEGLRQLMKTPCKEAEEVLYGIRELVRTPKEKVEKVIDGMLELMKAKRASTVNSPESGVLETLVQSPPPDIVEEQPRAPGHAAAKRRSTEGSPAIPLVFDQDASVPDDPALAPPGTSTAPARFMPINAVDQTQKQAHSSSASNIVSPAVERRQSPAAPAIKPQPEKKETAKAKPQPSTEASPTAAIPPAAPPSKQVEIVTIEAVVARATAVNARKRPAESTAAKAPVIIEPSVAEPVAPSGGKKRKVADKQATAVKSANAVGIQPVVVAEQQNDEEVEVAAKPSGRSSRAKGRIGAAELAALNDGKAGLASGTSADPTVEAKKRPGKPVVEAKVAEVVVEQVEVAPPAAKPKTRVARKPEVAVLAESEEEAEAEQTEPAAKPKTRVTRKPEFAALAESAEAERTEPAVKSVRTRRAKAAEPIAVGAKDETAPEIVTTKTQKAAKSTTAAVAAKTVEGVELVTEKPVAVGRAARKVVIQNPEPEEPVAAASSSRTPPRRATTRAAASKGKRLSVVSSASSAASAVVAKARKAKETVKMTSAVKAALEKRRKSHAAAMAVAVVAKPTVAAAETEEGDKAKQGGARNRVKKAAVEPPKVVVQEEEAPVEQIKPKTTRATRANVDLLVAETNKKGVTVATQTPDLPRKEEASVAQSTLRRGTRAKKAVKNFTPTTPISKKTGRATRATKQPLADTAAVETGKTPAKAVSKTRAPAVRKVATKAKASVKEPEVEEEIITQEPTTSIAAGRGGKRKADTQARVPVVRKVAAKAIAAKEEADDVIAQEPSTSAASGRGAKRGAKAAANTVAPAVKKPKKEEPKPVVVAQPSPRRTRARK